jgi:hypothetical protein
MARKSYHGQKNMASCNTSRYSNSLGSLCSKISSSLTGIKIHCAGKMVPAATSSAPNAVKQSALPTEPIEFDGIALFLVKSLDSFLQAFKDPYFINVIEPDEQILLDKDGPGGGIMASWQGRLVSITKDGKSVQGEKGDKYRALFEQWENKKK